MSERPSRFVRSVLSTLSDSAKRQFSGNRPGVLWLHIDYLPPAIFDALAHAPAGPSFLDLLALAVLNSPKRNHLCQIIFSGGAHLTRTGTTARSGFRKVVYQSPCCRFGNVRLFSPDKAIEPSKAMESSKAKSLLRHLVNAAEQKKIEALTSLDRDDDAISACDTLVARFYRNRSPSDLRETAAASLVFKGALLERKGEPEKAVGALSEALLKFGPTSETPAKNALNAFVERAGLLYDLDRYDEALADCDEFLAHFDAAGVHEAPQFVAKALLVKGVSLAATGHIADAVNALEEVIERFSNAAADLVADYVLHAREILRQLRNDEGRV